MKLTAALVFSVILIHQGLVTLADESDAGTSPAENTDVVDFARDIWPIFVHKCNHCHGEDEQEGGLRLDRGGDALAGGDRGPLLVPGRSSESLLIQFVTGENDEETIMPPAGEALTAGEISLLRRWVDQGALWPRDADLDGAFRGAHHWSYQPVRDPSPPAVMNSGWVRNPIDAFVLSRLEAEGIAPAAEADRVTWIRRLHLDLIGLPPTPSQIDDFLSDLRPEAYERLVDRLLSSPHFGERWGRHWLDLARYADSDGYEDDKFRPDAWRFRDWVVKAFNDDMPYDRFTIEQLAGDLLDESGYEQLVATGFHRMTLSNDSGGGGIEEEFRVKAVKDRVNTTGTVWMGMTIGCAECHSHKYDPISLSDYYQFYAFFNNGEEARIPAPRLPAPYYDAHARADAAFFAEVRQAEQSLREFEYRVLPLRQRKWEERGDHTGLPRELRAAVALSPDERTIDEQTQLDAWFRRIDVDYRRLKDAVPNKEVIKNNRPVPPSEHALVLVEGKDPRTTRIHKRGNFLEQGDVVVPGFPRHLPPLETGDRPLTRLDLAHWLVSPDHPLTSRVAVNAIWQHLFRQGLVATPEDFGLHGEPPSHPELLDWLAADFMASGWSRKELIRKIVNSATYRQSSRSRPELVEADPENRWLARQHRFRLEGEIVRDVALAASGLLEPRPGGPSVQPPLPVALMQLDTLKIERFMEPSVGEDRYRRGMYTNVQRTFVHPTLLTFDSNDPNTVCTHRDRSNTPLQALTLLNDPAFLECAQALGRRVIAEGGEHAHDRLTYAFRLCLSRHPDEEELTALLELLDRQQQLAADDPGAAIAIVGADPLPAGTDAVIAAAWIGVARTILNLDEFITRD